MCTQICKYISPYNIYSVPLSIGSLSPLEMFCNINNNPPSKAIKFTPKGAEVDR